MTELGHIGDGVYVSHDDYQLWLAANDHNNKVIALEPTAFLRLLEVAGRLWGKEKLAEHYEAVARKLRDQI